MRSIRALLAITAVLLATPSFAATRDESLVTGTVEVRQPDCECPPIVTVVDGHFRALVVAPKDVLEEIAGHAGRRVTVAGELELVEDTRTGSVKHLIEATRVKPLR